MCVCVCGVCVRREKREERREKREERGERREERGERREERGERREERGERREDLLSLPIYDTIHPCKKYKYINFL